MAVMDLSCRHNKNARHGHNGDHSRLSQYIDQVARLHKAFISQNYRKQDKYRNKNDVNHIFVPLYVLFTFAESHTAVPPLYLYLFYRSLQ